MLSKSIATFAGKRPVPSKYLIMTVALPEGTTPFSGALFLFGKATERVILPFSSAISTYQESGYTVE
jgi:hypothetical protein